MTAFVRSLTPEWYASSAPRISGPVLAVVVWLLESPLGWPLLVESLRRSGIPQAVREVYMPEPPTFQPRWPKPPAEAAKCLSEGAVAGAEEPAPAAAQRVYSEARGAGSTNVAAAPRRWAIGDFAAAYRSGAASPEGVAERLLQSIADSNCAEPPLCCFIACDAADVRRQAAASAQRFREGRPLSLLDGVPYSVIDGLDALPYATTAGTTFLANERPIAADAPCVAALRAAGALLVGKNTLHEVGVGMTGLNIRTGTARNPHDPARFPGGSSSGSAAAVAAGLVAFALGIDGGGSVRVPAALCGVAGLRPTVGRTAAAGCPDTAFSIMSVGPLAPSVADAMLVHAHIANAGLESSSLGPPPVRVPASLPRGASEAPLAGKRVGVYWPWFRDVTPHVLGACRAALVDLEHAGAEVVDVTIPELEGVRVAQILTISSELRQAYKAALADPRLRCQLSPDTRISMAAAGLFTATDYLQAQKIRTRLMTHFRRIFWERGVHYVAQATVGMTAPAIRGDAERWGEADLVMTGELMRFTICVNMAGIPAISIPIGHCPAGLPIGLQMMGRPWREDDLVVACAAIEARARERNRLPRVFYDVLHGRP